MKSKSLLLCFVFCMCIAVVQARAGSVCATAGNLVANCGFETGDFTGWTLSGNDVPGEAGNLYGVETGADPFDGISPNSGNWQAFIDDFTSNPTTLSQTLSTVAGDMYTISFYLVQDTAAAGTCNLSETACTNDLSVDFGGTSLASLANIPVEDYTLYSYTGTATSNSTVFSLTLGNDLGQFLLDDVSVTDNAPPVPEPSTWSLLLAGGLAAFLFRKRLAQVNLF